MTRDRRAGLLRRLFDQRSFGDNPTPFAMDWMLLVLPLLAALGWVLGWLAAVVAGRPQPGETGWLVGGFLAIAYWLAAMLGTVAFWSHDRLARAARRRDTAGPFEQNWTDSATAAFRALGQPRPQDLPAEPADGFGEDLWSVVDDRPRAVIMEAFARLERLISTMETPPPTAAARAYASLRQLERLAVLHEFAIPPRKAREFLYLCARIAESLAGSRD